MCIAFSAGEMGGPIEPPPPCVPSHHCIALTVVPLSPLVFCNALHRISIANESAVDVSAFRFFGAMAASPSVPAALRGAAAQALGAYRQHAWRMRARVCMGSGAAATVRSVFARSASWQRRSA